MAAQRITVYSAKVELALKESGLSYKRFEIDLQNKPEWYAPKVNPASKVPAIAYGGPDTEPENPSPESTKIAESYVLLEFIADLVQSSKPLLPATPVGRAQARFFIETATSKFVTPWYSSVSKGDDPSGVLPAIDAIQDLLPPQGGYAVGNDWTIADAAITPFLARALVTFKHDIGAYDEGEGKKVWELLQTDSKYARFRKYYADVTSRQSFKETFFEDIIVEGFSKRFGETRAAKKAASAS
ncbi:hypothetical protein EST38_g11334 [Candolleomyces aberdarensis]|uniref:Uncharacterized protein n=1 Tax=Candolleomyces aberdarensis TaxID=2316362 RepID=A0A4Q2D7E0_9AGAR|nr:hypothetical protein EST38_g11334 [Candolleomyces aberdarensis]